MFFGTFEFLKVKTDLKRNRLIPFIAFACLLLSDCAKMGSVSGGDKDESPPVMLGSSPSNYSVNFTGKKFEVTFDEFIVLKNIMQELVVSPPLKERPVVKLKNKTMIVEINNELRENTTYTFNFGQAIADNNEGNPLPNFEFVFSTGPVLDSLSVYGKLYKAFDLKIPEEPYSILLHSGLSDSAVLKEIPMYVGKSDKKGYFSVNNLPADTFKVFVLKDQNNNFLFDLPNEEIAFLDTSIVITPGTFSRVYIDTVKSDTLAKIKSQRDALRIRDSLDFAAKQKALAGKLILNMALFTEDRYIQFIADQSRKEREALQFVFNKPVTDSFRIFPMVPGHDGWYLREENAGRDTFRLWINDSLVFAMDTISIGLMYEVMDSTGILKMKTDTLSFTYREPVKQPRQKQETKGSRLKVETIRSKGITDLHTNLPFRFNYPLKTADSAFIRLFVKADTIEVPVRFEVFRDSVNMRAANLRTKWKEKSEYRMMLFPGAFSDIYGNVNDSLDVRFSTREDGYYGVLHAAITGSSGPLVVQLMDMKEKVLREEYLDKDGRITFSYLNPEKYKIKFIHDSNGNRKWDTGDYLKRIQPERVEYYEGDITIRSNWELEIKPELKKGQAISQSSDSR